MKNYQTMKDYKLTIQINSPWVVEKINYLSKANSVFFIDYSQVVAEIFEDFETDKDFNLFRFELCTLFRDKVRIKKYNNGYRIESKEIDVSTNQLAICLPRRIRKKYFRYDNFYEKYFLLNNLYHYYL